MVENKVSVNLGDIKEIEKEFRREKEIGNIVMEKVKGGCGIIKEDEELWKKMRKIWERYGVIWVEDEVKWGFGSNGKL